MGKAGMDLVTGNPLQAAAEGVAGLGLAGVGAFSGVWNTATAIGNGMTLSDAASGVVHEGGALLDAGEHALSDAGHAVAGFLGF
jgi:hypothetical protein